VRTLKTGEYNTLSATSAQFTIAKTQGLANVSTNSSRSECPRLGWRTPRVDSLKLVYYTITENAHKVRKKIFVFLCSFEMYIYWADGTDTGLCVPL